MTAPVNDNLTLVEPVVILAVPRPQLGQLRPLHLDLADPSAAVAPKVVRQLNQRQDLFLRIVSGNLSRMRVLTYCKYFKT
jgi:hypothetical protein